MSVALWFGLQRRCKTLCVVNVCKPVNQPPMPLQNVCNLRCTESVCLNYGPRVCRQNTSSSTIFLFSGKVISSFRSSNDELTFAWGSMSLYVFSSIDASSLLQFPVDLKSLTCNVVGISSTLDDWLEVVLLFSLCCGEGSPTPATTKRVCTLVKILKFFVVEFVVVLTEKVRKMFIDRHTTSKNLGIIKEV